SRDVLARRSAGKRCQSGSAGKSRLTTSALSEFGLDSLGYDSGRVSIGQQPPHSFVATRSKIERPVVDIHPHEAIGFCAVQIAAVLQGVLQCLGSVRKTVANALFEQAVDLADHIRA